MKLARPLQKNPAARVSAALAGLLRLLLRFALRLLLRGRRDKRRDGARFEVRARVLRDDRALLLDELPKAGFSAFAPADGAFYLYCDVGHMTDDAAGLARTLLDEAGVAVTPGIDFDAGRGNRFLRFSYAGTNADMAEAARRLKDWAGRRR